MTRRSVWIILIAATILNCEPADADVLYNQANEIGGLAATDVEYGEVVRLAEVSIITRISAILESPGVPSKVDDIVFHLYTTARPSGSVPDSLLWTGILDNVVLTRTPTLYSIDVPSILVPNVVAFSLEAGSGGELRHSTAVPSASHFGQWVTRFYRDGATWRPVGKPFVPLAVRLEGEGTGIVPEPSSISIGITALVALAAQVSVVRTRPSARSRSTS